MKTKHIVLAVIGGIVLCGFGAFVLIFAFLLTVADDVEREEAGKLTIAVRHKMLYQNGSPMIQCVQPEIGVCETPAYLNRETHRVGGSSCKIQNSYPQPFLHKPEISDWEEYEFDLEPDKTRYWYVYLDSDDECGFWLSPEYERFETGEIKLAQKEIKRIEKDFTK